MADSNADINKANIPQKSPPGAIDRRRRAKRVTFGFSQDIVPVHNAPTATPASTPIAAHDVATISTREASAVSDQTVQTDLSSSKETVISNPAIVSSEPKRKDSSIAELLDTIVTSANSMTVLEESSRKTLSHVASNEEEPPRTPADDFHRPSTSSDHQLRRTIGDAIDFLHDRHYAKLDPASVFNELAKVKTPAIRKELFLQVIVGAFDEDGKLILEALSHQDFIQSLKLYEFPAIAGDICARLHALLNSGSRSRRAEDLEVAARLSNAFYLIAKKFHQTYKPAVSKDEDESTATTARAETAKDISMAYEDMRRQTERYLRLGYVKDFAADRRGVYALYTDAVSSAASLLERLSSWFKTARNFIRHLRHPIEFFRRQKIAREMSGTELQEVSKQTSAPITIAIDHPVTGTSTNISELISELVAAVHVDKLVIDLVFHGSGEKLFGRTNQLHDIADQLMEQAHHVSDHYVHEHDGPNGIGALMKRVAKSGCESIQMDLFSYFEKYNRRAQNIYYQLTKLVKECVTKGLCLDNGIEQEIARQLRARLQGMMLRVIGFSRGAALNATRAYNYFIKNFIRDDSKLLALKSSYPALFTADMTADDIRSFFKEGMSVKLRLIDPVPGAFTSDEDSRVICADIPTSAVISFAGNDTRKLFEPILPRIEAEKGQKLEVELHVLGGSHSVGHQYNAKLGDEEKTFLDQIDPDKVEGMNAQKVLKLLSKAWENAAPKSLQLSKFYCSVLEQILQSYLNQKIFEKGYSPKLIFGYASKKGAKEERRVKIGKITEEDFKAAKELQVAHAKELSEITEIDKLGLRPLGLRGDRPFVQVFKTAFDSIAKRFKKAFNSPLEKLKAFAAFFYTGEVNFASVNTEESGIPVPCKDDDVQDESAKASSTCTSGSYGAIANILPKAEKIATAATAPGASTDILGDAASPAAMATQEHQQQSLQ